MFLILFDHVWFRLWGLIEYLIRLYQKFASMIEAWYILKLKDKYQPQLSWISNHPYSPPWKLPTILSTFSGHFAQHTPSSFFSVKR